MNTKTYTHNETDEQRRERLSGWRYEARNLQERTVTMVSAGFDKHLVANYVHTWLNDGYDVHLVNMNEAEEK